MVKFFFVLIIVVFILFILKNKSDKKNIGNIYKKAIFLVIIIGFLLILVTSGKFILPQILQILKIGLPLLTKFVGI